MVLLTIKQKTKSRLLLSINKRPTLLSLYYTQAGSKGNFDDQSVIKEVKVAYEAQELELVKEREKRKKKGEELRQMQSIPMARHFFSDEVVAELKGFPEKKKRKCCF